MFKNNKIIKMINIFFRMRRSIKFHHLLFSQKTSNMPTPSLDINILLLIIKFSMSKLLNKNKFKLS